MVIPTSHRSLRSLASISASVLVLAALGACGGGGPVNENSYPSASRAANENLAVNVDQQSSGTISAENTELTNALAEASKATGTESQQVAQEATRQAAIQAALALQEGPTTNTGRKMLMIGLDANSSTSDNSAWLAGERFANMSDEDKAKAAASYVSLAGKDLKDYYTQSCPSINDNGDFEMYRCAAGIYFGKNTDGKLCFTTIDWEGYVQHVNDTKIAYRFKPGTTVDPVDVIPSLFTKADAGGNMQLYFRGARASQAGSPSQSIALSYSSAENSLTIKQLNTDPAWGDVIDDTCTINMNGIGG